MSITKENKVELIKKHGKSEQDTGSVEVQCAIMTERINNLNQHLKSNNKKDEQSKRGLLRLVYKRKRLLNYIKSKDESRHKALIAQLGLRK